MRISIRLHVKKNIFDSKLLKIRYNNIILLFLGKILRRMASNKDFFIVSF